MKKATALYIFLLVFFLHIKGVFAEDDFTKQVMGGMQKTGSAAGYGTKTDLSTTVGKIINGFLILLGIVFMILIIYGGFIYMTAGGDEQKITKAKDILKGAAIGMIIILSAYAIANFVIDAITASV